MAFSPIAGAEQIEAKYLRYLMTLFSINDPVYQEQFEEQIRNRKTFSNEPYLEALDNYLPGETIQQLVQEKVLPEFFLKFGFYVDRPLYKHQEMVKNNIEIDVKVKYLEEHKTQADIVKIVGTPASYVNKLIRRDEGVVNNNFVKMLEALGYDIELHYVKRKE